VEYILNKSPERIYLYKKAVGMIRELPLTGHGIGSFYLTSVRFSDPGDPNASIPNFSHNFLLQLAAEMGVPIAILFVMFVGYALGLAYRSSNAAIRRINVRTIPALEVGLRARKNAIFGAMMALTAYLITQMTANALNIYISNQFFFWFLMSAAIYSGKYVGVQSECELLAVTHES
jgi:O-antigen ligase